MSSSSQTGNSFRPPRSRGSKYHLVRVPPPKLHKMTYATGGLKQLYKRVKTNAGPQKTERGLYTASDGVFTPQNNMPLLASRYKVIRILGKGQSSVFLKAEDTFCDNAPVAIKVLHTHYHMLGAQESDCIRRLNNADPYDMAGMLRLRTMFRFDKHYCMVFELLHPRPLTDFFNGLDESKTLSSLRIVARRVLQTLGFLQQQTVIHADLKPENILLKKVGDLDTLKVVDFGNAIHCIHEELSLYYGDFELQTLLYRAPEVMFGLQFGIEIDLWSLGCILAELYIGKPLFTGCDKNEVMQKMVAILGPLPEDMCRDGKFFPQLKHFTSKMPRSKLVGEMMQTLRCRDYAFADFLLKLLTYRPADRLSVFEAACHPFLAPELGTAFLLPPNSNGRQHSYPPVLVDAKSYVFQPAMDYASSRRRLASADLLRVGTTGHIHVPSTRVPRQVGFVQPLQSGAATIAPIGMSTGRVVLQNNALSPAARGDPCVVAHNGFMVHTQASHSGQSSHGVTNGVTASQAAYYNGSSRGVAGIPQPAMATVVKETPMDTHLPARGSAKHHIPAASSSVYQSTAHNQNAPLVWQEQALQLSPDLCHQPKPSHYRQTTPQHHRTSAAQRMSPYLLPVKVESRERVRSSCPEYSHTNGHVSGLPSAGQHEVAPGPPVPTPPQLIAPRTRATPGRPDSLPLAGHIGAVSYRSLPSTPQMSHVYRVEPQPAQQIHSISTTLKEESDATPTKQYPLKSGLGENDLSRKVIAESYFQPVKAAPLSSPGDWGTPDSKVNVKALTPTSAREVTRSLKRYLLEQSSITSELPELGQSPDSHVNNLTLLSEGGETSSPESGHQDQKRRPLKKRIRTCLFQPAASSQSSTERPFFNRSLSTSDLAEYSTHNTKPGLPMQTSVATTDSGRIANGSLAPRHRSRLWIRKTEPATSSSSPQSDSEEEEEQSPGADSGEIKSSPEQLSSPLQGGESPPSRTGQASSSQREDTINIPGRDTAKSRPAMDDNDNHIVTSSVGEVSPSNQSTSCDKPTSEGHLSPALQQTCAQTSSSSEESGPTLMSPTGNHGASPMSEETQTSKTVKSTCRRNNQSRRPVHKKTPDSSSADLGPAKSTRVTKSGKTKQRNEQQYDENFNENVSQTSPPAKRRRRVGRRTASRKLSPSPSPPEADPCRPRSQRSTRTPRYMQKYCNTMFSSDEGSDSNSSGPLEAKTLAGRYQPRTRPSHSQPLKPLSAHKQTRNKAVRRQRDSVLNETYDVAIVQVPSTDSESEKQDPTPRRNPESGRKRVIKNKKPTSTADSVKKTIAKVPKTRGRRSRKGARAKGKGDERGSSSEEIVLLEG